MYYEDVEYSLRAKKSGFTLYAIAIVIKHKQSSLGKGSKLHEYYLARNHLLFVKRNATAYVQIREALRILFSLQQHASVKNTAAISGIKDFALNKFGECKGEL